MPPHIPWLNKDSRTFLERGYLLPGVTPEARIRQIAEYAEAILAYPGFADEFESYMHKGWYSLSTPIWTNFGAGRGLPISCFGAVMDDTMESILFKVAEVGMQSKHGGGTSAYFGHLRARGAEIGTGGKSSGPVHFMELFDKVSSVVSQSNVRRGSFAAYLPVEHPDIHEFLTIRNKEHTIQDMSIGITITDAWMESMLAGDKGKRKTWAEIMRKRSETGYPYLVWSDTVNNVAPQVYKDKGMKILASNLCLAPETQILTRTGYETIQDLADQRVDVWNGAEWSTTTVRKTGVNQRLYRVVLSNGSEISATDYHKWYTVASYNDQRNGVETVKRTNELKPGDKLCKYDLPLVNGIDDITHPYTNGAFSADGFVYSGRNRIWLYGPKHALSAHLAGEEVSPYDETTGRSHVYLTNELMPKFHVPVNASVECKLRWLEGFLDFEGCVVNVEHKGVNNQSLQAGSIHKQFLEEIKYLLQTLGVHSKVVHAADEGDRMMPDGRGGMKLYHCQRAYRILISSIGLFQLMNLGFAPKRLAVICRKPQRDAMQFVKVVDVIDDGRSDDTYCCDEPIRHKIVVNGVLTGNCSEIMLASTSKESFVCDLSSLNLLHFDDWKGTNAPKLLTYFLDAVATEFIRLTEHIPFMEAPRRFAINQRALGVGVLGWHSYLQSKMIAFESMEAKLLNIQIFRLIQTETLAASREMAVRYGEPPLLVGYGIRNVTTMAIAPTTSSSFILGQVSPSIEPENSVYYVKDLAKMEMTYRNPYLKTLLKTKDQDTRAVWADILIHGGSVQHLSFLSQHEKDVFKTFGEISPKEIIIQASARQRYIDQGQSLNLLIPPGTPPRQISELTIEAWRLKIKGLYYQRSANPVQLLVRDVLTCRSCEA